MSPLAVELEPALSVITCLIMNASLTSGGGATRWRLPHVQPDKSSKSLPLAGKNTLAVSSLDEGERERWRDEGVPSCLGRPS